MPFIEQKFRMGKIIENSFTDFIENSRSLRSPQPDMHDMTQSGSLNHIMHIWQR